MTSLELDWAAAQAAEADSTEATVDDQEEDSTEATVDHQEEDSTEATVDDEIRLDADRTDASKLPASEILVRTIAVEPSAPLAALPADADAAFSQWLSGSGLAPSRH